MSSNQNTFFGGKNQEKEMNLTIMAAEFSDNAAGGDVPVEDLAITAARHQLCVVPAIQISDAC